VVGPANGRLVAVFPFSFFFLRRDFEVREGEFMAEPVERNREIA
jgi:hypothetical protein